MRGFPQSYRLDYEETFSPVAKMVTVRSIFSLAAFKSWKLWQLDVKNAFLYDELDREVFMDEPKDSSPSSFLSMFVDWKRHCMALNKHHVLGMVQLLNTSSFVDSKWLTQILVYLLN